MQDCTDNIVSYCVNFDEETCTRRMGQSCPVGEQRISGSYGGEIVNDAWCENFNGGPPPPCTDDECPFDLMQWIKDNVFIVGGIIFIGGYWYFTKKKK